MTSTVVSICGRSGTGRSRPFVCEADDGSFYFVKSGNVSADELVIEYLVSRLAEECGLPVPPVALLAIPEDLVRYAVVEGAHELKPGTAFGSSAVPFADELRSSHLREIQDETKMRCLCFDWWVRNPHRRLDLIGGDPNMLWDPTLHGVALIDHGGALDPAFDESEFKNEHAFRDARPFLERGFLEKWRTKFESAIYNLKSIWEEIPPEWLTDPSGLPRTSLTRPEVESLLIKPEFPADDILPS